MFRPAERSKAKLRLALCSPSGGGKTWGALEVATGLGGKIAFIDTECGSGDLYAEDFEYDIMQIKTPYTPDKYVKALKAAEEAGYDIVIVDSLSHAWSAEGGILDTQAKVTQASSSKNSYTAWRTVTPQHDKLVEAILGSSLHVICTMRTKQAYEIAKDDKGRNKVEKLGLAPVQRDGMEYEFTVVLDVSVDGHIATSSKDRTQLFDGNPHIISKETGKRLDEWLNTGGESKPVEEPEELSPFFIIADGINKCKDDDSLKKLWQGSASVIQEIKETEPDKFKELNKIKDSRKAEFEAEKSLSTPEITPELNEVFERILKHKSTFECDNWKKKHWDDFKEKFNPEQLSMIEDALRTKKQTLREEK